MSRRDPTTTAPLEALPEALPLRYTLAMITLRRSADRGHFDHGWLSTSHTFSFAGYHDPKHMGFRALRVINEDRVDPGQGFGTHSHRDMEIVSYVLSGALEHHDDLGNGSVLHPGQVQRMSAGTGVTHSESNPSPDTMVHFLQIWLLPDVRGIAPSYEEKTFADSEKRGRLRLVASRDGREGSVTLHSDVDLYATLLAPGERCSLELRPQRHAWVHVIRGSLGLDGHLLTSGDGAALSDLPRVDLAGVDTLCEALVFDLA